MATILAFASSGLAALAMQPERQRYLFFALVPPGDLVAFAGRLAAAGAELAFFSSSAGFWSPMILVAGQILNIGHFLQPTAIATGQMTINVSSKSGVDWPMIQTIHSFSPGYRKG